MNFKLSSSMCPSSEAERMEMSRVPYASAMGSLMYAMICTRPDIAQAVAVVSRFMADPGKEHWNVVKRILRYIKGTSNVALCLEDQNSLSMDMSTQTLQVILINENLLQICVHTCRRSYELAI